MQQTQISSRLRVVLFSDMGLNLLLGLGLGVKGWNLSISVSHLAALVTLDIPGEYVTGHCDNRTTLIPVCSPGLTPQEVFTAVA